jgi:Bor protein
MHTRSSMLLVGLALLLGCYHATIETGAKPSTLTIEQHWASGWVFGLVPPKTVETAAKCPSGVAKVETRLSFLNQLVSFLTLSIYTPMEIVVTCAEEMGSTSMTIPASTSSEGWQAAFSRAAERAVDSGDPVYVGVGR